MTNRQAKIKRLKEAFQKVEQLINDGYVVQWEGNDIIEVDWSKGISLLIGFCRVVCVYADDDSCFGELTDLSIGSINIELSEV